MNKRKVYGAILGILAFALLMVGITYAWFTWTSGNTIISGTSGCFTINYSTGTAISGALTPSIDHTGGRSTTVTMNIDASCTTTGTATIYLTTNASTTVDLTQNAVKYEVYNGSNLVENGSGYVAAGTQALANINLTKVATTYTIYVWVDGELVDNSYIGKSYSGYINVSAVQTEE